MAARSEASRSAARLGWPDSDIDETLALLRSQLGPYGYQWLCACAVYPRLRFSLSTFLGRVVADRLGRPPPLEDEDLALFSLPWFRQGWMPENLRLRLVDNLDERLREPVRLAIERAFYTVMAVHPADDGSDAVRLETPPRNWSAMLRAFLDQASGRSPVGDTLFIRYMHGRDMHPESIAAERRLARVASRPMLTVLEAVWKGVCWLGFGVTVAGAALFSGVHLLAFLGLWPQSGTADIPDLILNDGGYRVDPGPEYPVDFNSAGESFDPAFDPNSIETGNVAVTGNVAE